MSKTRYQVAVVGGAGMWGRYYLRVFAGHPECRIVRLVDRSRERRAEFARRYRVDAEYDNVEELLAETVPDIVAAVVPVSQNYPVVKACAEAGVRVVSCEKPISAELSEADAMLEVCRRHGTILACGQAAWATPYMPQVIGWIREGNIGRITGLAIPGGLPIEVSGAGCVQLSVMRIVAQADAEWVEGWELPPEPGYVAPGTPALESDVPAYGRIGLPGGVVCEIPPPEGAPHASTYMHVQGERGQAWLARPRPVLIQGTGPRAQIVYPDFLDEEPDDFFEGSILRLLEAFDTGREPLSSGADYHHALEIAIAIKLSAAQGHRRISLPLADRSHRLLPHPYRLYGGDVAGYESIGYEAPPQAPLELRAVSEFSQLKRVDWNELRNLLAAAEPQDVALALQEMKGRLKHRALMFLPGPAGRRVREAAARLGEVSPEDIAAAQQRIVDLAHRL